MFIASILGVYKFLALSVLKLDYIVNYNSTIQLNTIYSHTY